MALVLIPTLEHIAYEKGSVTLTPELPRPAPSGTQRALIRVTVVCSETNGSIHYLASQITVGQLGHAEVTVLDMDRYSRGKGWSVNNSVDFEVPWNDTLNHRIIFKFEASPKDADKLRYLRVYFVGYDS